MPIIAHSTAAHHAVSERPLSSWAAAGRHLLGPRGMYAVFLVAGLGLAIGGVWWGFAAILPFLYVLPCAAMMALCMKGQGRSGQSSKAKPDPALSAPGISDAGPR